MMAFATTRRWGLWPRSLLGRNLLLMAALIVLGQLVAVWKPLAAASASRSTVVTPPSSVQAGSWRAQVIRVP